MITCSAYDQSQVILLNVPAPTIPVITKMSHEMSTSAKTETEVFFWIRA